MLNLKKYIFDNEKYFGCLKAKNENIISFSRNANFLTILKLILVSNSIGYFRFTGFLDCETTNVR